jgi:hypothetical protein
MDERDSFAQADQQVSALRERITRHRDAMERAKQRGHSTAAAARACRMSLSPTRGNTESRVAAYVRWA